MFSKGDELYDKRFGERYVVLETARDSGGEFVRIEDTAAPGPSRRPMSARIQLSASGSRCSRGRSG